MTENYPHITVYGATGHTGRLVCRELARRNRDFVAAGRRFEALQTLSQELGNDHGVVPTLRTARVDQPRELDDVLERTTVLINCAGPFTDLGPPVARAAIRNDVHYLDTTGEQGYLRWMREELQGPAERRELVLLPACAYEYATGTVAAAVALRRGATRIGVCYSARGLEMSAGTKRSVIRSIADRGFSYEEGQYVERRSASRIFDVPTPGGEVRRALWFPGGEPYFVPLLDDVETVECCVWVGRLTARLLSMASGTLPKLAEWSEPLVDRLVEMWHDEQERGEVDAESTPFKVIAFEPDANRWLSCVSGFEPYTTTSRLIVEAAIRLKRGSELTYGFQTPARLFDPLEFAESAGLEVRRNEAL